MQSFLWMILMLALLQGFTEFLPVSSSGHLVIAEALLGMRGHGIDSGVIVEVIVHVGTLAAVIWFFRKKVTALLGALVALVVPGRGGYARHAGEMRYIGLAIIATIPAALVGLFFNDAIESAFDSPRLVSLLLVATGIYLLACRGRSGRRELDWRVALVIGIAQAIAILPGISRSGSTIATALLVGVAFETAAEFSFIISIPAVLGALVLELAKDPHALSGRAVLPLLLGVVVAFISGFVALKLLVGALRKGVFHRFAYYLLPAGAAAFIYFSIVK